MAISAGIYAKLSQDRDGQQSATTRQVADCRQLANRLGWVVVSVYEDVDVSAYDRSKRRPAYERMLEDMAAGVIEAVLVYDQDRLVRHPAELERFFEVADRAGTKLHAVTGSYDISTDVGRFIARSLGNVANMESAAKSRRLRRKHVELAEQGRLAGGGRRPFGFEPDRITIRDSEAQLIRNAAERVLLGESLTSVIRDWDARGVQTVTGALWKTTTLKRMLMSGRISGQREHKGEIVSNAVWPGIITPEQTVKLRARLSDPGRNKTAGVTPRSYLLTGFVYCGRCNVRMTTRPTERGKRRYVCVQSRGGCDRCGISADQLEADTRDVVLAALQSADLRRALQAGADDGEHAGLLRSMNELEGTISELDRDYYEEGLLTRDRFIEQSRRLTDRLEGLRRTLQRYEGAVTISGLPDAPNALRITWDERPHGWRRALLATVLDCIVVAPTSRADNRYNPERIEWRWRA